MDTKNIIVGIGEILWDIFPESKQLGGAPANFAYHCMALGAESYPVSCVGNDNLGIEIRSKLESLGLSQHYIAANGQHSTGTVTVEIDKNGKPDYVIHENVAWDHIPLTDEMIALAQKTEAVCFGTLAQRSSVSRNTIRQFIQATGPVCLKVCDINLRQHYYSTEVIRDSLECSNILKLNDEELAVVAETIGIQGSEDGMLYRLLEEFGLNLIVLTKGSNGSRLVSRKKDIVCKGMKVETIVDTVGAGDVFTAAIIIGLLHNAPFKVILEQANRLACYVCSQVGATPKIPRDIKSGTEKLWVKKLVYENETK